MVTAAGGLLPDPRGAGRYHYAGLGGSGMSALAQFQSMLGGTASGSDRAFDRGERPASRAQLERLGIAIHPQDGSGVRGAAVVIASTAVEADVPDLALARDFGVPIVHRSDLLARFVADFDTIAIAGTSGKSTVVAMTFEILRGAGRGPSVITGGELRLLQEQGLWGNAWYGGTRRLVIEADESDGSLVRYTPEIGVLLNLQRDHKETSEVAPMFEMFRRRTRGTFVASEDESLAPFADRAIVFGRGPRASVRGDRVELEPDASRFEVEGVRFALPVPGAHNVMNALAAIAACRAAGVPLAPMVEPLAGYRGVARRFQSLGVVGGVEVVDDFAHNPAKIAAACETARRRARRIVAVYQPHGYGPTRFLRADLVDTFATSLAAGDRLWLLEVFYAGGTTTRDFSSADIAAEIAARGVTADFAPSRTWLVERIVADARPGDLVLVMGARDPSLTRLALDLRDALGASATAR